ncbi:hypothetical protein HNQ80_004359 [Anaerosolibacter carboniphilus]|uniref:Uncharacterized protein n=1 Tax=Anaerosolibacter carboniphilus TaxID=1417629 RepID=A0A841L747_9FIRM|nr:hypothetical protein [Anaerosolibacter carboniphilus]MBB6218219.1 hypothetical protein [Anaerosolibacter carboniphilus]
MKTKSKVTKPKELPKCVHCGKDVVIKKDGGKVRIPTSITLNQFPIYSGGVIIHNKCLNPCIQSIIEIRSPIKTA